MNSTLFITLQIIILVEIIIIITNNETIFFSIRFMNFNSVISLDINYRTISMFVYIFSGLKKCTTYDSIT